MANAAVFSHEVGFYGLVRMATAPGGTPTVAILATGGDVSLNTDPIFSSGVWGAGWYTAANQVAYAVNYMRIEGSASFELAYDSNPANSIFGAIASFGFDERANHLGHVIEVLPQGKAGFRGKAWCSGVSFDASADSIVTGNINYSSGELDDTNWLVGAGNKQPADGTKLSTGTPPSPPTAVYPYWGTSIWVGASTATLAQLPDIVNWSANYTSEINFVTLCSGRTASPVAPDYIMVGGMDADGSFTIFSLTEQLTPSTFQSMKACEIRIKPGSDLTHTNTITFPYIVYNSGSTSIQTGGTYIQADVSFSALGDGTKPPMSIS